jgi:hypothetical protein
VRLQSNLWVAFSRVGLKTTRTGVADHGFHPGVAHPSVLRSSSSSLRSSTLIHTLVVLSGNIPGFVMQLGEKILTIPFGNIHVRGSRRQTPMTFVT